MTTTVTNNPYGSYIAAEKAFSLELTGRRNLLNMELGWGKGFLSWKKCRDISTPTPSQGYISGDTENGGSVTPASGTVAGDSEKKGEQVCETQTPGSVIESQLENQLGSGVRQLELADEINEIVNALVAQLVTQVFAGGQGLAGASKQRRVSPTVSTSLTQELGAGDIKTGLTPEEQKALDAGKQNADRITTDISGLDDVVADSGAVGSGSGTSGTPIDFALRKPVLQSGQTGTAAASRANDGNTNGVHNEDNGSVARTLSVLEPYWQVDLGRNIDLGRIAVYPRTDNPTDPLKDFYVFTSLRPFSSYSFNTTLEQTKVRHVFSQNIFNSQVSVPMNGAKGRYVFLQEESSTGGLFFDEIGVEAWSNIGNAASGKTVAYALRALGNPWAIIDLGQEVSIDNIVLKPLARNAGRNSYGRNIHVFVAPERVFVDDLQTNLGFSLMTSTHIADVATSPTIINLTANTTGEGPAGRYVRVQRAATSTPLMLELAEVRVFDEDNSTGQ